MKFSVLEIYTTEKSSTRVFRKLQPIESPVYIDVIIFHSGEIARHGATIHVL